MMESAFSLFPLAHFCKANAPNGTKAINIQMLLRLEQELVAVDTVMLFVQRHPTKPHLHSHNFLLAP